MPRATTGTSLGKLDKSVTLSWKPGPPPPFPKPCDSVTVTQPRSVFPQLWEVCKNKADKERDGACPVHSWSVTSG